MTLLQPYQERMIEEITELKVKIEKLKDFILTPTFKSLNNLDRGLLIVQFNIMQSYKEILSARIRISKGVVE